MTVSEPYDEPVRHQLTALVTAVLTSMTPAFYTVSWTPWVRYMVTGCMVVVLIIVVVVTGTWVPTRM